MRRDAFPRLEKLIEDAEKPEWAQPVGYTIGQDSGEIHDLLNSGAIDKVIDPFDQIIDDLYEYNHPDKLDDQKARVEYHQYLENARPTLGRWFYFPWAKELVRYPEHPVHYELRTSRNRNLITKQEQNRLRDANIAVLGLSVGRSALNSLVLAGVGKEYLIADPDTISVSNLNRMNSDMSEVGLAKTTSAGRMVSRIDPYIKQVHMSRGYSYLHEDQEVVRNFNPSLIVEEMDALEMKMVAREQARKLRVPLLMATDVGERSILEVERYDIDDSTQPFHGRLGYMIEDKLYYHANLTDAEKRKALIKINGMKNLSPRMIDSALEIGKSLPGMAQLGRTAFVGGALVAVAAEEIILGRKLESGSRVLNLRSAINGRPISTPKEVVDIFGRLIKSRKGS
jgi:tRNA A37 threonylcarbamoyladenosine dehydratase